MLAPQPFYQERGTPIAVNHLLSVLSERGEHIDVLTYHEGKTIKYDNVNIYRISKIPFIRNIRPGPSWKKLVCDFFMLLKAIRLASKKRYDIIHSVEESVYMAIVLKKLFGLPYIYDMDSSLVQQVIEKYPLLSHFGTLLNFFEEHAVKNAKAVVVVCSALSEVIHRYKPEKVIVLEDVSLLHSRVHPAHFNLRTKLGINGLIIMYVGNLEHYQGIDLLLESFALMLRKHARADLVVIGGETPSINKYEKKCHALGIQHKVHFPGSKQLECLANYLLQADILVSPRIKGINTPMKLYSYLHSGKSVLATDLPPHTQVLNRQVAMLAQPSPEAFSKAMLELVRSKSLRSRLGNGAKRLVEERYTEAAYRSKLAGLYDWPKPAINQKYQQ